MPGLEYSFANGFLPPQTLTPCQWAEASIVLPPRIATPFPGPYRTAVTPYVRGIIDTLQDVRTHTVVVAKGAQTGLTQAAYVALCYWAVNDPGPILLVYPNEDLARSVSETRVMPIFEESPILARELPENRRDEWTKLQYRLARCTVNWVGSNSPASLASRPVRYLILDEVDKYPPASGREADPVNLAVQRTKTFWNRKILMISTPTTDTGAIWRHYEHGDQRRYYVPCHACGAMQFLAWSQVKFDAKAAPAKAAAGAYYECEVCKAPWTDLQKVGAVTKGEWRPTKEAEAQGVASFHLSSLYAPWVTWAGLVEKFLKSQSHPEELRDFVNSDLGEPYRRYDARIRSEEFLELEGQYDEGQVFTTAPGYAAQYAGQEPVVLGGVDVQKGYMVAVFRAYTEDGDSGLIWAGEVSGFDALDEQAAKLGARYVFVDQRYRTREVQEWSYDHTGYIPTMGVTTRVRSLWTVNALDLDEGRTSRTGQRVIETLAYDADQLKDILAMCVQKQSGAKRWLVPRGYAGNAKYCAQMTAERSVNGKWVNPQNKPNHYWDAEALTLLAALRFGHWGRTN